MVRDRGRGGQPGSTGCLPYDANNRRTIEVDPVHFAQTYIGYDSAGNLTVQIDPKGEGTYFTYDLLNRQENLVDPGRALTYTVYDITGNLIESRVEQGWGRQPWSGSPYGGDRRSTYFEYDQVNRVSRVIDPEPADGVTRGFKYYLYDADDNRIMDVDESGRPTYFGYDKLNREDRRRDGLADTSYLIYDGRSSLTKRIDPEGRAAYYDYDALARLIRQSNALGQVTYFGYDAVSNRVKVESPRFNATTYTFDRLRRVSKVTNALSGARYFGFDASSNTIFQQDELFNRTYFMYDGLSRTTRARDAANADSYFGYDARSSLVLRQDADLRKTYFSYDGARRLLSQEFATDQWIYHRYDAVGNMTLVRDETGLSLTAFDRLNRPKVKAVIGGNTYYEYEPGGLKQRLTDAGLNASYFGYDMGGRENLVALIDTGETAYYDYDKAGLKKKQTSPVVAPNAPTILSYWTYDGAGRLLMLEHKLGATPTSYVNYFAYTRDANGSITKIVHEAGNYSYYDFDALDRVTKDGRFNVSNGLVYLNYYTYDAASNRIKNQDMLASQTTYYSYNNLNLINLEWVKTATATKNNYYSFDASQRMTKGPYKVAGDTSSESVYYSFNQRDLATMIQDFNGTDSNRYFTYNGRGERVLVNDGSFAEPNYWTYDGPKLLTDKDLTLNMVRYRHGSFVEMQTINEIAPIGYPAIDHRGSVASLVLPGSATDTLITDLFGSVISSTNNAGDRLRFLGEALAELTTTRKIYVGGDGLIYLPSIGRSLIGQGTSSVIVGLSGVYADIEGLGGGQAGGGGEDEDEQNRYGIAGYPGQGVPVGPGRRGYGPVRPTGGTPFLPPGTPMGTGGALPPVVGGGGLLLGGGLALGGGGLALGGEGVAGGEVVTGLVFVGGVLCIVLIVAGVVILVIDAVTRAPVHPRRLGTVTADPLPQIPSPYRPRLPRLELPKKNDPVFYEPRREPKPQPQPKPQKKPTKTKTATTTVDEPCQLQAIPSLGGNRRATDFERDVTLQSFNYRIVAPDGDWVGCDGVRPLAALPGPSTVTHALEVKGNYRSLFRAPFWPVIRAADFIAKNMQMLNVGRKCGFRTVWVIGTPEVYFDVRSMLQPARVCVTDFFTRPWEPYEAIEARGNCQGPGI